MSTSQWKLDTKIGFLYLVSSEKGIQKVSFTPNADPMASSLKGNSQATKHLNEAVAQLEAYFKGALKTFTLPIDIQIGTPFQKKVWNQLQKIPYGATCAYKDIATGIQAPKAIRAVGSANGKNPLCIVIPCHRVIAADGGLGGYSGGLNIKKTLLDLEK